jgi:hypothetical protein
MKALRFAAAAALVMMLGGTALAQTTLRIGLAEDPTSTRISTSCRSLRSRTRPRPTARR